MNAVDVEIQAMNALLDQARHRQQNHTLKGWHEEAKERRKAINQRFVEGKARIREDSTHDAEKLHEKQKLYRLAKQELTLILRGDDALQDLESGLASSSIDKPVTNSELLHDAQQTHHKTTTMLQSGLRDLVESQQIGQAALQQLKEDNDAMLRVQANVDAIDSELVIARKLLTRVVKSLASDKILVLFLCLISVVICGVVVMSVTKKF